MSQAVGVVALVIITSPPPSMSPSVGSVSGVSRSAWTDKMSAHPRPWSSPWSSPRAEPVDFVALVVSVGMSSLHRVARRRERHRFAPVR
jgi:hypothetical protein